MAVLPAEDRAALRSLFASRLSRDRTPLGVTKAELRAAIDAVDDWIDANSASYNAALPQPFASQAGPRLKAALLMFVIQKRYEVL